MPYQSASSLLVVIGAFNAVAGLLWGIDHLHKGVRHKDRIVVAFSWQTVYLYPVYRTFKSEFNSFVLVSETHNSSSFVANNRTLFAFFPFLLYPPAYRRNYALSEEISSRLPSRNATSASTPTPITCQGNKTQLLSR